MGKIIPIEANLPHQVSELICLKCLSRYIAVYPVAGNILKKMECPEGHIGFVIKTGQEIIND